MSARGFFVFGGSGNGALAQQSSHQNARNESDFSENRGYTRKVETVLIGPQTINRGTFWESLTSSNKTWHVIERDFSFSALVPIWEVVEHYQDLLEVAQTLRSAWCQNAKAVIDECHPLMLDEDKKLVIQLYDAETNRPRSMPAESNSTDAPTKYTNWVPAALQAVQDVVNEAMEAQGECAAAVHQSALVDSFRVVRSNAPSGWQSLHQLRYMPFKDPTFCGFVEKVSLVKEATGGRKLLHARLQAPDMREEIMRLLRDHAGGTDAFVQTCYPNLVAFLVEASASEHTDKYGAATIADVLGIDFPDAIPLSETCTWLQSLSKLDKKVSESTRTSAASQVLQASLAALEKDYNSLNSDEQKSRVRTHIDHFNRICRNYNFFRTYFKPNKEPSPNELRDMADQMREALLRDFELGSIVRKSFRSSCKKYAIDGRVILFGHVIRHDEAPSAHVEVQWSRLSGVEVLDINEEQLKSILGLSRDIGEMYEHVSDLHSSPSLPSLSSSQIASTDKDQVNNAGPLLRLCADRSSEQNPSTPHRYVDMLRWRMPDVFKNPNQRTQGAGLRAKSKMASRMRKGSTQLSSSDANAVPLVDVYSDLEVCEEIDQVLICASLLDQRKAVPLFWKRRAADAKNDIPAVNLLPALAFLRARLEVPRHVVDLHTDEKLPRVLFYEPSPSSRPSAAKMSNDILHTCFRRNTPCDFLVSLEMSVGFMLQEDNLDQASYMPCLVFLVRGDAHLLPKYLSNVFDASLVVSSCSVARSLKVLPEFLADSIEANCVSLSGESEEGWSLLKDCPQNWTFPGEDEEHEILMQDVQEFIRDIFKVWERDSRRWISWRDVFKRVRSMVETNGKVFPVTSTILFACATEDPFHNLDLTAGNARSNMELQKIFSDEARMEDVEHTSKRLNDLRTRLRPEAADRVLKNPLMNCFLETLQSSTRTRRLLWLQRLDEFLSKSSLRNGRVIRAEQRIADIDNESSSIMISPAEISRLRSERRHLVAERYGNCIDVACLSREMGHLYSSLFDTRRREVDFFPDLAAQLLLDGGTIEFMDGDAAKVNEFWVSSVLRSLNVRLSALHGGKDVRVSVRSVFGMQSCGKSTVLNTMFGCRLQTSAGMCTRGINMFLVPCERPNSPFQAILGLDTEGICSPEQERQGASETAFINNRMALLSILLADAGLCISTTESNDIFRETLSIVMAVYNGSDMAAIQKSMCTRLFFLYNRSSGVDEVNGDNMKREQDRVFFEVLREAWRQTSNQLGCVDKGDERIPPTFLTMLNKDKDIERAQQLNQGPRAPNDVPDLDFGRKLAKFNDHINSTLTDSSLLKYGTSLTEFIDRVKDVNEAVHWGKNYLGYRDILRYNQNVRERGAFEGIVHEAAKVSYDTFMALQAEMVSDCAKANKDNEQPTVPMNGGCLREQPSSSVGVASAFAEEWESSPWSRRTRQEVLSAFDSKHDDMRQALKQEMGDTFDHKIPEYENEWKEKMKLEIKAKDRAMREKWMAVNGIAPRLKLLKKRMYRELLQKATSARNQASVNQLSDSDVFRKFERLFVRFIREANKVSKNVDVINELWIIAHNSLKRPLAFGMNNKSQDWYKNNVIYAFQSRNQGDSYSILEAIKNTLMGFFYADKKSQSKKEYIKRLQSVVEGMAAKTSDEFTDFAGREILNTVDKYIEDWDLKHPRKHFSDLERTDIHMYIIAYVGRILQEKQNRHHTMNGLAGRLEKEKENMRKYFSMTVRGREGIEALSSMLQEEIRNCLRASRETFALKHARELLDSKAWLRTAEGSLALVDFDILQHYKNGRKREAIDDAGDDKVFKRTIGKYIDESLNFNQVHEAMLRCLKSSLDRAKDACQKAATYVAPWRVALDELEMCTTAENLCIDLAASRSIVEKSPPLTEDLYETAESFFEKLTTFVEKLVPDKSQFNGVDLYEKLGKDMPSESSLQPRCGAACPRCHMPCMKELGHNINYSGLNKLHQCTHQPVGLAGVSYMYSRYLVWQSCVDSKKQGDLIVRGDERCPYAEFRKWYPEWEDIPDVQHSRPVREFLFFNCQTELVQKYPKFKKCEDLDKSNFDRHRLEDLLQTARAMAFGRSGRS